MLMVNCRTWAGQDFNTPSGKPEGDVQEEEVKGGSFNLPASSVALLTFGKGKCATLQNKRSY